MLVLFLFLFVGHRRNDGRNHIEQVSCNKWLKYILKVSENRLTNVSRLKRCCVRVIVSNSLLLCCKKSSLARADSC